jgi:uncharacterized membrane protein YeaQ/YmgE (transglycosylase-associated protein family)
MSGIGWLTAIVVGVLAGWIAEKIMRRDDNLIQNLIVGVVGALIGKFVLGLIGVAYTGFLPSLGAAVLGAVILLAIIGLFQRRRPLIH